ncbi:hypothetical protein [Spongiactinospora sp. 9N601]|uniref:hypothetical protein n=1 Tax=Spongiactinospora sp. 9N601 TaxID=3375149 RepID=UPI00378F8761
MYRITPLTTRGNLLDQTTTFYGGRDQQRLFAGTVAFARVPLGLPHTGPGSVIGLTEALYQLLINATEPEHGEKALLPAVGDAHWLDEESLSRLEFLCANLPVLPAMVVLTCRPDAATLLGELRGALTR